MLGLNFSPKLIALIFILFQCNCEENDGIVLLTKIVINFAIIFYLTGIFQTDIGDQMTIGLSDKGYKSVQLRCGSGSMLIELKTEEDFDGVIYTRGSFYDKNSPCFLDPATSKRRSFSIKFPLDQCNTQKVRK
jgi:hypothetical protein